MSSNRSIFKIAVALALGLMVNTSALALKPIYSGGKDRAAIRGYDVVSYFTENKAVKGSKDYRLKYRDAIWHFSSEENKKLFAANPRKYAPQYGGYCAYSVARDSIASTKPEYFSIHKGKLYLNYNKATYKRWLKNKDEDIDKADNLWPGLRDK